MIPQTSYKETYTVGNTETEQASIELTPHMFDMLSSKVYSNKILAVVREILCNARDAQVMAGVEKPIKVHLPSQLEPYFSIRDFGTGLSEEQVMKLYLRYGYSDKRTSNDVIGGLGIGSKSPLAYSDSFLVISFYEGTESTYSVYKDQGIPQVSKLSSKPTEEPNGVMVKVTVKPHDRRDFESELKKFIRFFDYPVEGNNIEFKKPTPTLDTEYYSMYSSMDVGHQSGIKAIMGGVVYSISSEYTDDLPFNRGSLQSSLVLLKFDIGKLSVAASREALSEDKITVENIKEHVGLVYDSYVKDIQAKLNKEDTPIAAWELLREQGIITTNWKGDMVVRWANGSDPMWKGKSVKDTLKSMVDEKFDSIQVSWGSTTGKVQSRTALAIRDKPTVLIKDRRGVVKLGSRLSHDYRKLGGNKNSTIIVIDKDDPATEKKIRDTFKDPEFLKVSEIYEKYFPKSEKVTVAKSGLFTLGMSEVSELEEDQEGWYFLFHRDDLITKHNNSGCDSFKLRNFLPLIRELKKVDAIEGDIFVCRKGGLPSIKKTKMKELTVDNLYKMVSKKIDSKVYMDSLLRQKSTNIHHKISLSMELVNDICREFPKKYPLVNKMVDLRGRQLPKKTPLEELLWYYSGILDSISDNYEKLNDLFDKSVRSEKESLEKDFPLLTGIGRYGYNSKDMKDDLKMYLDMKFKQLKSEED